MQEIIVYRNPMEAAMWGALGNGELFPIMCGVIIFFTSFLVLRMVGNRFFGTRYIIRKNVDVVSLIASAVVSITTIIYMISLI